MVSRTCRRDTLATWSPKSQYFLPLFGWLVVIFFCLGFFFCELLWTSVNEFAFTMLHPAVKHTGYPEGLMGPLNVFSSSQCHLLSYSSMPTMVSEFCQLMLLLAILSWGVNLAQGCHWTNIVVRFIHNAENGHHPLNWYISLWKRLWLKRW